MKHLGYYTSQFPFPHQGRSAGPYAMFLQPPNASLMRVRVACVAVGQQIGQPVKPNLKMQRARRRGCACRHRGLGQGITEDQYSADSTAGVPSYTTLAPGQAQPQPIGYDSVTGMPIYATDASAGPPSSSPAVAAAVASDAGGTPNTTSGQVQSPPGTQLLYQVSWSTSLGHFMTGASQAVSAFQQGLPQYGMEVVSSNVTSPPVIGGITGLAANFLITDQVGHDTLAHAQGVCDSLMRSIVGNNLAGSSLVVATGGAGLPFNLGSFLGANWAWVAAGVGAVVLWKVL